MFTAIVHIKMKTILILSDSSITVHSEMLTYRTAQSVKLKV